MRKLVIVAMLFVVACIGMIYGYSSKKPQRIVQNEQERQKKRERSRSVYKGPHNPHADKLPDIAATSKGDVRVEKEIGLPTFDPISTGSSDIQRLLTARGCDADAVVIGSTKSSTSQLTEDESFLYTTYQFDIEEVLKDNAAQPLNSGQSIAVIRTGGSIDLNGRKVVAEYKAAKSLEVGQHYLLYLTFLPEKSSYAADNISYQIKNNKIFKLTEQSLGKELESGNDADSFISRVRAAVSGSCAPVGGGR